MDVVFMWIWGIVAGGAILSMLIAESVNTHIHGDSIQDEGFWIFVCMVGIFLPLVLMLIPVIFVGWIFHLIIGFILKKLGKKK